MSPEKKEQAIEKACGWEMLPEGYFHPDNPIGQTRPNYLADLNSMHEAKKVLTDDQAWEMVKIIVDYKQSANGFPMLSRSEALKLHSATAKQEAEAFLRVMGLLEKEQ